MAGARPYPARVVTPEGARDLSRQLPEEVAVALSYNGSSQAVMMATPADLEDFGRGFTLTEGIAAPEAIESITPVETPKGIDLQIWLAEDAAGRLAARRRSMAGPVGCGLCGIESLEEAVRDAVPVSGDLRVSAAEVRGAMTELPGWQPLHDLVRGVHAAGFWVPGRGVVAAREDVGRHNALDKLAGALLAAGEDASQGAVLLTSRVSLDMVQKVCRIGAPLVIAVSAPTGAALELARAAGLTVVALARGERFEVFTHASRVETEGKRDVA